MIDPRIDQTKLGSCCNCGREDESVRTIVTLELKSPEPGPGCWGCMVCGLPQAGAVAVLCDDCCANPSINTSLVVKNICLGFPGANRRMSFSEMPKEPFRHDATKHAEESERFRMMGNIKVAFTNYLTSIMQWRERHGEPPLVPEAELTEFAGQLADEIIKHLNQILHEDLRTLKLRERHGRN